MRPTHLLLFGAVQATMIGWGIAHGERPGPRQTAGILIAAGGFVALSLPGATAPSAVGSLLMISAGVAWGVYSLRGRSGDEPIRETAGNFLRAVPIAVILSVAMLSRFEIDPVGVMAALVSGGFTSGVGYAIWYTVLPRLTRTEAATVQLSVPVVAALAGMLFLSEPLTGRLMLASAAILGGIALVTVAPAARP